MCGTDYQSRGDRGMRKTPAKRNLDKGGAEATNFDFGKKEVKLSTLENGSRIKRKGPMTA